MDNIVKAAADDKKNMKKIIVKTMTVKNSVKQVFDFFSEGKNLELGGAINSLIKNEDSVWTFEHNIAGKSMMKNFFIPEYGILDHIFIGGGLEWHVFIRAIPNGQGSTTTWTFIRPDGLNDNQFEEQLENFEIEITKWKKALEYSK
ncbi:MAG: hypothetical protein ACTHKC_06620 [Candidatus Nitrosocosmicus sp.]